MDLNKHIVTNDTTKPFHSNGFADAATVITLAQLQANPLNGADKLTEIAKLFRVTNVLQLVIPTEFYGQNKHPLLSELL